MKPTVFTLLLAVLIVLTSPAQDQDAMGIMEWKSYSFAEKKVTLTINGKKKNAKLKATRFDVSFKGHGLPVCVGDSLTKFYDRTSIPVLFPEAEFKGTIFSTSPGHVHVQSGDDPGKDAAMVVTDKLNTLTFSGDATIGSDIYFVEEALGYKLEEPGTDGKAIGQVVFPPNVIRFAVKEPDMPFAERDLFQAAAVSDFDFQLQLHLSEQLTAELNALEGAPPVEIQAAGKRIVPRMTVILRGVSRTSLLMIVPFPKEDAANLEITVDRFKASIDMPKRIQATVPPEATNKAAEINYQAPTGHRPELAHGLLTKPKDAKTLRGKQQGSWNVPVPSDSYAIIRSRPRARLRTIDFVQIRAQDISHAMPAVNPQHPMHAILTSDEWKQGFAAIGAPIPMMMVGPPGALSRVTFANPGGAIGNPLSNIFGFASSLVPASQAARVRGQTAQQGVFFLWAPPPPANQQTGQPPLPKVEVEFLDPNGDQAQFAFCYAPECNCHEAPPTLHGAHNLAQFACKASWDHKSACPCGDGDKCERKVKEMKVIKMKITIEGVPYATLDYRPLNVEGFRIGSSFQQLVLDEGSHTVTVTVLFKPTKAGTYGPKSIDFLKYTSYYYDKNSIKAKPAWASVELKGEALKCGVVWNCVPGGGRPLPKPKKQPKIIVHNKSKKSVILENVEHNIHSAVPPGSKTTLPAASNGAENAGISFKEQLSDKNSDSIAFLPFILSADPGISFNGNAHVAIPANAGKDAEGLITRTLTIKLPAGVQAEPDQVGAVDQAGNFYALDSEGILASHLDGDGNLVAVSGRVRVPISVKELTGGLATKEQIKKFGKPKKIVEADISLNIEPVEKDLVGNDVTLTITMTELVRADFLSRPKDKKDKPLVYDIVVTNHSPEKLRYKNTERLGGTTHQQGKRATGSEPVVPGVITGTVSIDPKKYDPEKPNPQFVKVIWYRWARGKKLKIDVEVGLRKEEEK